MTRGQSMSAPVARPKPPGQGRAPRRRTQVERSAATRRKLLTATIACLVKSGYAGASTTAITRRAGVSQGALFRHYPTKTALLAAALGHLYEQLITEFRAALAATRDEGDEVRAGVRLLWDIYQRPELLASYELHMAARTDAELQSALAPILERHWARIREEARALFPETARTHSQFDDYMDVLISTMQGAAIGSVLLRDPDEADRRLAYLVSLARSRM